MNGNPKAASPQESIASHFDFADATDPAERERLLMEELRRTQSALVEADIEIKQKQCALVERAFEQEAADARDLLHAACRTADFDDEDNPTGFGSPTSAVASSATKPGKVCPATAGARTGSSPPTTLPESTANSASPQRRAVLTTSITVCGARTASACGSAPPRGSGAMSRALRARAWACSWTSTTR